MVAGVGPCLVGPGLNDGEAGPVAVPVDHVWASLAARVVGDDRDVGG